MATSAREISEGIPTDKRVFAPPPANKQDEAPRYLCFIGSLIEPQTATDRPWTKGGGIEISNPCLRVVQNFIRKGRITPLLMDTHEFLPYDFVKKTVDVDPLQAGYFRQPIPEGYRAPTNEIGAPSAYGSLVGKLAYPGQQLPAILIGPENVYENQRRGIMELKPLAGQPYKPQQFIDGTFMDPAIREIQLTIFPKYPFLPLLLDDLEKTLIEATEHTMLREIVDIMLDSLSQFRDYANTTIQNSHAKMREIAAKTSGYIPRYTAMDLVLLDQLGLARQDREIQRNTANPSTDTELRDLFKQFLASQIAEKTAAATLPNVSQTIAEINADTMAAAPIAQPAPEQTFPCECGSYPKPGQTGSEAGLAAHKRQWCKLNDVKEPEVPVTA